MWVVVLALNATVDPKSLLTVKLSLNITSSDPSGPVIMIPLIKYEIKEWTYPTYDGVILSNATNQLGTIKWTGGEIVLTIPGASLARITPLDDHAKFEIHTISFVVLNAKHVNVTNAEAYVELHHPPRVPGFSLLVTQAAALVGGFVVASVMIYTSGPRRRSGSS